MALEVAKTILEQLGGRRFMVMTGAKNFVGAPDSLFFMLPGNARNRAGRAVNKVVITLTDMDDYTVTTYYVRAGNARLIDTVESVYADNLQEIFTQLTGLYTRL